MLSFAKVKLKIILLCFVENKIIELCVLFLRKHIKDNKIVN